MIYKFSIRSEENEDFIREIEIDGDQTFLDLHNTIQKSTNYDNSQIASFYLLDNQGQRGKEIALFEMSSSEEELDIAVMDVALIREFSSLNSPRMEYVFDFFSNRSFQIELTGTYKALQGTKYPFCSLSEGDAPQQIIIDTETMEEFDPEEIKPISTGKLSNFNLPDEFEDDINEGPAFENLDDYEDIL